MDNIASERPSVNGFSLVLPDNWSEFDLKISGSRKTLRSMIASEIDLGDEDVLPVMTLLTSIADEALQRGAIYVATMSNQLPEHPLTAALVATRMPRIADQIHLDMSQLCDCLELSDVSVVEIGVGKAIRASMQEEVKIAGKKLAIGRVHQLQYFVQVPQSTDLLVFSFTTPNLPLTDAMDDLFDAIAETIRWT